MKISGYKSICIISGIILFQLNVFCQKPPARVVAGIPVNYSEDSVGVYTLPDPLVLLNGKKVTDAKPGLRKEGRR